MTGIIVKVFGRFYSVLSEGNEISSVLRGKMKTGSDNYSNPVAVGDIVDFSVNIEGLGIIESVGKRKNTFTRKDGVRSREDIIACNLDQVTGGEESLAQAHRAGTDGSCDWRVLE